MNEHITRRKFIQSAAVTGAAVSAAAGLGRAAQGETLEYSYQDGLSPWPLGINTSTIRPAGFREKIEVTAEAGYDCIELWGNDLEAYENDGGDLEELGAELKELGLDVPNVIGLWNAIPPTWDEFEEGLEATKERLRRAAAVGAKRAAAVPMPDREEMNLKRDAEMYRELLRIGREEYGVIVGLEFLGFLDGIHRLSQACAIAIEADDPDACIINDMYHLYRGGSGMEGMNLIDGSMIGVFHWNDVPSEPPREELQDADRIMPGDGILPLEDVLRTLWRINYRGALTLELFNRELWERPPEEVAQLGLERMRENVRNALENLG